MLTSVLSRRTRRPRRAFGAAVAGLVFLGGMPVFGLADPYSVSTTFFALLFLPLEIYAVTLLVQVSRSSEVLEGRPRTHAKLAAWIAVPSCLAFATMVVMIFVGPIRSSSDEIDLRKWHRADVLIGTWEGDFKDDKGTSPSSWTSSTTARFTRYQEIGPDEAECTGTWAFEDWTLYVRFEHRTSKGKLPLEGKLGGYPLDDFKDDAMILSAGKFKLHMTRRK